MQVKKSSCAQGQPGQSKPMMIIMARPNFLGQELPPCRLTYLFSKATLPILLKSIVFELRKGQNQDQNQSERHTTPP